MTVFVRLDPQRQFVNAVLQRGDNLQHHPQPAASPRDSRGWREQANDKRALVSDLRLSALTP
jgi:hypothetical protein